jgi:hypothetical protein
LIIRDVFRLLDNEREGLIQSETFWRELESNSIVLLKEEKESLQEKYLVIAEKKPPRVNYKLFERDLIIVSHLYAEMAGMIEAKTRNTPQLLETIVKEILNEFNNLEDFARANDTKKSSYLVKGNIKSGFGKYKAKIGITDEDFEKQFEELYKLVNPHTSETRIYYYKFSENLSKYVTPIILKVSLL